MTIFMSDAAYLAAQDLKATDITLTRSQIAEIIAALLGYGSYAALIIEERRGDVASMDDAICFILDIEAGKRRSSTLGCLSLQTIIVCCHKALKKATGRAVYMHPAEFFVELPWPMKDEYEPFHKTESLWKVKTDNGATVSFTKAGRAGIKEWTLSK